MAHDLVVLQVLSDVLPALSDEEFEGLEQNILADGKVHDPLICWKSKEHGNAIVDGMHRKKVIDKHGLTNYTVEFMEFTDILDAKIWMLERALRKRNITNRTALKKMLGDLYNIRKQRHGGQKPDPNECGKGIGQSEQSVTSGGTTEESVQNDIDVSQPDSTAETIAKETGTSVSTVVRAGKFAEYLDKLPENIRKAIVAGNLKATEADVKALSKITDAAKVQLICRDARTGTHKSLTESLKAHGVSTGKPKPPKDDKPKDPPLDLDKIADELHAKLKALKPSTDELKKLRTYEDAEQVKIYRLIDGDAVKTVTQAIKVYEDKPINSPKRSSGKATVKTGAADIVDGLMKQYVGPIARGINELGKLLGEGPNYKTAYKAHDTLIKSLKELRKGDA